MDEIRTYFGTPFALAAFAEDFIIDVNADDGVGPKLGSPLGHLVHCLCASDHKFLFIGTGASANDIADACRKVTDEIYSGDHLSEYDAFVFFNSLSFNGRRGCKYQIYFPLYF